MTMFQNLGRMMRYQDTLKIECACGHKAEFSQKDAFQIFGEDAIPSDIRRRLRCSACHEVGKVAVTI